MRTDVSQRWRDGRDTYRPAGETIRIAEYEVAPIVLDNVAKAFVLQHHYSASYPAARYRYGLYRGGELVGVAVYSVPANYHTFDVLPGTNEENVELGRFVLVDDVPANGETWFLGRCWELLRAEGLVGVVSFSDPMPRYDAEGRVTFRGHIGTIYQAHNGVYLGRSKSETVHLLPDGTVLHRRALSKLKKREKGWRALEAHLSRFGVPPLLGDPVEWVAQHLVPRLTKVKHPGNLKYAWTLRRRDRRHLPESLPYVKVTA